MLKKYWQLQKHRKALKTRLASVARLGCSRNKFTSDNQKNLRKKVFDIFARILNVSKNYISLKR